jgi:hypothetical protein
VAGGAGGGVVVAGAMKEPTWYQGQCERCKRRYMVRLEIHKADSIGVVPPPVINVACACAMPVTNVTLVYDHEDTRSNSG